MTDHPLTRKKCWEILPHPEASFCACMQASADWQLKQCLEFLRTHKFHERHDYFDLRADNYANLLEDAMRPIQENN